jgi:predicted DNA-binding transcriptional regulator AlpA
METQTDSPQETAGFLTVNQLLERLPISRRTLYLHRKKGLIPSIQLGDRLLFDWASVRAALLRRQRVAE